MKVRISIGNLAPQLTLAGATWAEFFGILNRKAFEKGRHQVNPVGGAALMTENGKRILERSYGAEFQEGFDARFVVDERHLENILLLFETRDPSFYEIDPRREIMEELSTKELPLQDSPVMSPEEAACIRIDFVKSMRQLPKASTSAREVAEMPTYRLFNLFRLTLPALPQPHLELILNSPAVRIIAYDSMRDIRSGKRAQTSEGWQIGDNFMW